MGKTQLPLKGLLFYRRCDSVLLLWDSSLQKPKPESEVSSLGLMDVRLHVCVSCLAPEPNIDEMLQVGLKIQHLICGVWNPLRDYSPPRLQLSRLFMKAVGPEASRIISIAL